MKNRHIVFIIGLFLLSASPEAFAQTGNDYVSTAELYEGRTDIVAGVRVALEPGFHATEGSMVHIFIGADNLPPSNEYNPTIGNLVIIGDNPSTNKNYIKTTCLRGATSEESLIKKTERMVEIEYLNGFGNPEMNILVKGSPDQKDLVSNILKYGIGGRVDMLYLPCEVEDNDGKYQTDIFGTVENYYNEDMLEGKDGDGWPYKQYLYDGSPLNRGAGLICEGYFWQTHPTHIGYKCNASSISQWKANANGSFVALNYPIGSLRMEEYTDEDGHHRRVYSDNLGSKVREETVGDDGELLRTAYVYDDLGYLRCVVSPKAISPDDTGLCYFYTYDAKGRIIEKTIPDHGTERCVYDKRSRMVMSQDGNLLANGEWAFSLYDVYGRVVGSGFLSSTMERGQLQALFDEQTNTDEQWTSNGGLYGYSGASIPAILNISAADIHNINWYDQYDFLSLFQQDYSCPNHPSGEAVAYDTQTKGLTTGCMDKALLPNGDVELLHVNYYDVTGRLLCSVNDNHLGGRTNRFYKYNFNGEVTEECTTHTANGRDVIITRGRYTYDHVGRKLQEFYKLNNTPEFIAKAYQYNAVGDLLNTYLYSSNGGNTFAQKLKYHYNIRGWLCRVNDIENPGFDFFALKLTYNRPNASITTIARYNGNISQMWSSGCYAIPFGFGFSYDKHDRLIGSQYVEGVDLQQNHDAYTEDYGYDANGNLQYLWRVYEGSYIDELYYDYYPGTNRIENINDRAENTGGYNAHTHPYFYDYNGNPTYDPSRHATLTYNRLNKPVCVSFSPTDKIRYSYTSTGTKLRKEVTASVTPQNLTTDYCGEFMYEDGELVCVFTPFGRIRPMNTDQGTQWRTYYSLTDHLGNVRAEFVTHDSGQPELVQQTDYYPFGYILRRNDYASEHPNRRLYGGKELQNETLAGNTLGWYDFEARMYDPLIGRFMTTDAKEEKYYNISPYVYCLNNPMIIVDPTGDTVRYADDNSREIVESLLCKTNKDGSNNSNYSRAFAKKWKKLNKSKTDYTFSLNNDLKPELGRDINGKVSHNLNGNGYLIEFTQNKGSRIKGDGGFSPEYAALFEETFHAWDIDKGSFDVGQQTAMDEARAWQFAATAPGTKDITTEEGVSVYSAAYTIKNMPTKWVAKMLKEGCQKRPFFDWVGKDGTIYSVAGTLIQGRPYHDLNYGKSFHQSNQILLQNLGQMDSICFEPKNLKYFRKKLVIQNGCKKEVFSGCVEGEILFCKIVENMLVYNKENHCFYDKFCSYSILSGLANDYESDMNRIALGPHVFVKGQVVLGKEVGEWEFKYTYKDLDFLFMTANYKNGKLDGTAKFYKPDGRLYQEAEFAEGKLVLRIWYNEEGEIIYRDYYENNTLVRTEQFAKDPRVF